MILTGSSDSTTVYKINISNKLLRAFAIFAKSSCTVLVYRKRQNPRYGTVPVLYYKNQVDFVPTVKLIIDYLGSQVPRISPLVYLSLRYRNGMPQAVFLQLLFDNFEFFDEKCEVARTASSLVLPHFPFRGVGLRPRSFSKKPSIFQYLLKLSFIQQFFTLIRCNYSRTSPDAVRAICTSQFSSF